MAAAATAPRASRERVRDIPFRRDVLLGRCMVGFLSLHPISGALDLAG
jgi:hypothetical protein